MAAKQRKVSDIEAEAKLLADMNLQAKIKEQEGARVEVECLMELVCGKRGSEGVRKALCKWK